MNRVVAHGQIAGYGRVALNKKVVVDFDFAVVAIDYRSAAHVDGFIPVAVCYDIPLVDYRSQVLTSRNSFGKSNRAGGVGKSDYIRSRRIGEGQPSFVGVVRCAFCVNIAADVNIAVRIDIESLLSARRRIGEN